MRRTRRTSRWATILAGVLSMAGCATGRPLQEREPEDALPEWVQFVVTNERFSTVTAWAQWGRGGTAIRLGEVGPGDTRVYDATVRGGEVRVLFSGTGRPSTDTEQPPFLLAAAYDRFEWILMSNREVFFRRIRD